MHTDLFQLSLNCLGFRLGLGLPARVVEAARRQACARKRPSGGGQSTRVSFRWLVSFVGAISGALRAHAAARVVNPLQQQIW